ncbi:rho guanine nucleotide exchange factor 28-like [Centroberyx gerrardi]
MGNKMELSRREAPLYGQAEADVTLQEPVVAPEEAEIYVVLRGSRLTHVTLGKRRGDGLSLCFTVPGHDLAEVVSVAAYVHTEDRVEPCGGEASLGYVGDAAQEVAEYLSANRDRLTPRSYLEVLSRFSTRVGGWGKSSGCDDELSPGLSDCDDEDVPIRPGAEDQAGLRELDERITLALANMDYPQQWRNTDRQPREVVELQPKETLLHLAVRLDLLHLSRFLIHQPRGQRALTLPNQEGDTPLQLAQKGGEHALFRVLATPPVPAVGPVVGVWCVWSDSASMLRFCPGTDSLTLTVQQAPGRCPRDSIVVLRDRLGDHSVLKLITELRGDTKVDNSDKEDDHASDGDVSKELHVEEHVLVDSVFEEQLVLSLDDDEEEEYPSSLLVNGHPIESSGVQSQPADCAAVPLVSMIHSRDQASAGVTQRTQEDDADVKYRVGGVTSDSTGTDSRLWDAADSEDLLLATDTPPPGPPFLSEDRHPPPLPLSIPSSPSLSPADQVLARLSRPAFCDLTDQRESPPLETCDLSPSLVALEVDSEEESAEPKSPLPHLSSDTGKIRLLSV